MTLTSYYETTESRLTYVDGSMNGEEMDASKTMMAEIHRIL
jgi:hypothetical protein